MRIRIDGETSEVTDVRFIGEVAEIEIPGASYIVAPDHESAGREAREYWEDMAENDPSEFTCMVGESTLVAWALGQFAGPGSTQVSSLEEWLDLWLDTPEEHWAGYDGNVTEGCDASISLRDELGFNTEPDQWQLYRSN